MTCNTETENASSFSSIQEIIIEEGSGLVNLDLRSDSETGTDGNYDVIFNDRNTEVSLLKVDSKMPLMLSELMKTCLRNRITKLSEAVINLERDDPLRMDHLGFYEYKIKELLGDVTLDDGYREKWESEKTISFVTITKGDGTSVRYTPYDRRVLEDCLFRNSICKITVGRKYEDGGTDVNLKIIYHGF